MDTFDKIHAEIKSCHYSAHACTGNTQNGVCQGQHYSAVTYVTMIKMLCRINVNADFSTATLYLTNMHTELSHKIIICVHLANIGRNILDLLHSYHRLSSDSRKYYCQYIFDILPQNSA